jgi:ribonucleoside-diphosphate reductase alpha chain
VERIASPPLFLATLGEKTMLQLDTTKGFELQPNAQELLKKRYFMGKENSWKDFVKRVASHPKAIQDSDRNIWFDLISQAQFLPSRMPYMGTAHPFASSCFVLPIEDSLDSIMTTLKDACTVQKFGGGTGYNFSNLRPAGDRIKSTTGEASGPISFMTLFHHAMEVVKRAGRKHAAQMGILNVNHPDIMEFINCKEKDGDLWTFNISIGITDDFMRAVQEDSDWDLTFGGKVYKTLPAKTLWDAIIQGAWRNGEPGVIFLDTIATHNRFPEAVNCTNPCGEAPLPPYTSCNLGSLNLGRFYRNGQIAWKELEQATRAAVRFLDGSLDTAFWPVEQIKEKTHRYRNLGLGIMGLSDLLCLLGVPYEEEGVDLGGKLMQLIDWAADDESKKIGGGERKNVTTTMIAPTGSISFLANSSSGCEPIFGVVQTRNTYLGSFHFVNWVFEEYAKKFGFGSEKLYQEIAQTGSVQGMKQVPDDLQYLFRTANEIDWHWHVLMQAELQQHTEQAVSKSINMAYEATPEDVNQAFRLSWEMGCKSTTVYRNNSRAVQAIDLGKTEKKLCPSCLEERGEEIPMFKLSGCISCATCGYSVCEV